MIVFHNCPITRTLKLMSLIADFSPPLNINLFLSLDITYDTWEAYGNYA